MFGNEIKNAYICKVKEKDMTEREHREGNRIIKYAMLCLMRDIMEKRAVAVVYTDEGYENEKDMVHFSSHGHKCTLLAVNCPNPELGVLELTVRTELNGKMERVEVPLFMSDLHINTVIRIANEVYDLLWLPEEDEDWTIVYKDYVADFLDTYLK